MASKDKKTDKPEKGKMSFEESMAFLLRKAETDAEKARKKIEAGEEDVKMPVGITLASTTHRNFKYTDFCDVTCRTALRPFLPFEYFFGCRGLISGRLTKIDADEATGKSSFLYLLYGMAQRTASAFTQNHETEEAPMLPHRIADLGCNPEKLVQGEPVNVVDCLDKVSGFVKDVRALNADNPIVIGIDSVSGLAERGLDLETGEELNSTGGMGFHSRKFGEFFRNNLKYYGAANVCILGTGQNRAQFSQTAMGMKSTGKTAIADAPFKFHSTWMVDLYGFNEPDNLVRIECTMTKNKVAAKGRKITLFLYRDRRGWDLATSSIKYLFSADSPFEKGAFALLPGGKYRHEAINGNKALDKHDFMEAFYQNTELIMRCREKAMIYGFGFPFENDFTPSYWEKQENG